MKRITLLIVTALLVCLSLPARDFVLVVGVSKYANEVNNLSQTTKDAKAFREVMLTQTKDVSILTSSNANKSGILSQLRAICNRAQGSDRIIFFFSGHGVSGGICCYDGVIPYSDLTRLLATSSAKQKICFIDACHAGSASDDVALSSSSSVEVAARNYQDQAFIVSCRSNEYSYEGNHVGAGFFSQGLIKGIRGKSDRDGNRQVSLIELFKYVYSDVVNRSRSQQHPQMICASSNYDAVVTKW